MIVDEPEWPAIQRGEFYGFISGTTNLTCEANAEPPAHFTWLDKNNNEIIFGQVYNQDHKSTLSVRIGIVSMAALRNQSFKPLLHPTTHPFNHWGIKTFKLLWP